MPSLARGQGHPTCSIPVTVYGAGLGESQSSRTVRPALLRGNRRRSSFAYRSRGNRPLGGPEFSPEWTRAGFESESDPCARCMHADRSSRPCKEKSRIGLSGQSCEAAWQAWERRETVRCSSSPPGTVSATMAGDGQQNTTSESMRQDLLMAACSWLLTRRCCGDGITTHQSTITRTKLKCTNAGRRKRFEDRISFHVQ